MMNLNREIYAKIVLMIILHIAKNVIKTQLIV